MMQNDFIGIGLYFGFLIALGLPAILLKLVLKIPFELSRKMYHMVITLTIIPLVVLFSHWYMAVLAVALLTVIVYPILMVVEKRSAYQRVAVERKSGEFKSSLLVVQLSIALVISVFWGLLGSDWKYIAVVAILAWGFGDAAAALIGKRFGRRKIQHKRIEAAVLNMIF